MANTQERAYQIWPLLVHAAKQGQILTYGQIGDCTGMAVVGLGQCLEPIKDYCLAKKLPPLTAIVVNKETGLPGEGFTVIDTLSAKDFAAALRKVFDHDWSHDAPDLKDLAAPEA